MAFIVFEGLDGAGKSTLIQALSARLRSLSKAYVLTREPGGSPLGEALREMVLSTKGPAPVPRAELLIYQAGRAQHVDTVIRPALDAGEWVLCDRYAASSVAFQCGGRGLAVAEVNWLNEYSTSGLKPDLTVLLDLEAATAKRRMAGRELDRFEQEAQDFHERVRQSYLAQAKADPQTWLVLSANDSREVLQEKLLAHLIKAGWLNEGSNG